MAARTPEALHAIVEDAFNRCDLDAYTAAYDDDAILVTPPGGEVVHGRDNIRAATEPFFAAAPADDDGRRPEARDERVRAHARAVAPRHDDRREPHRATWPRNDGVAPGTRRDVANPARQPAEPHVTTATKTSTFAVRASAPRYDDVRCAQPTTSCSMRLRAQSRTVSATGRGVHPSTASALAVV